MNVVMGPIYTQIHKTTGHELKLMSILFSSPTGLNIRATQDFGGNYV